MSADSGSEWTEGLGAKVRRGLVWSTLNTILLRTANLLLGIIVARLISPEEFGVWAVSLTVQTVLLTLADLGLSAEIVRTDRLAQRMPTVATIAVVSGAILTVSMALSAPWIARTLNAPDATPVIVVMSSTMLLVGFAVAPLGLLQRNIQQRRVLAVSAADLGVGTIAAVALIVLGLGPMALAISRVLAQSVSTVLAFVLSHTRPRFGFDRAEAGPALRYSVPLAAANFLSWAVLSIDNVVVTRVLGPAALGIYVLAFNIAMWPMNIIGQAVRSVSMAAFAHVSRGRAAGTDDATDAGIGERDQSVAVGVAISWAAAVPAGILLGALSGPLIELLYGTKWSAAGPVLAALAYFGILRVLIDILATYLLARGYSKPVFFVQVIWMLILIPTVMAGVRSFGIAGAAYAHLITGIVVVVPVYLVYLHVVGADNRAVLRSVIVPVLAGIPTWMVATAACHFIHAPLPALAVGGGAGIATYALLVYRWALQQRNVARRLEQSLEPATASAHGGQKTE
ncbi:oligosaccharide flippase family protein [Gordonia sp. DT101]|uniref:oligosaccharide flippase family protein n=1 Tax=Gordonia sp. DT101 TaxID=3416545 RepID=UPI003CEC2E13